MTSVSAVQPPRPRQNWVLSPALDLALIIATPILALAWGAVTLNAYGPVIVVAIFSVFNVAHHLPTFIRIYGDKDLLRRYRWSLLLGPVLPFTVTMLVASWLILDGQPVENIIFLFIIVTLWDPWHFLMQHYGFMRIYDRHNQAPVKLSAWMDYSICATWFVYLMIAAAGWLPSILYKLQVTNGLPVLKLFAAGVYPALERLALGAAMVASVVYAGYLCWCYRRSYYISYAKLLLLLITFVIMYFAYVPNTVMQRFIPRWSFSVGFATLGMVHVTQYLAIVWKYNRSLTARAGRARAGLFQNSFARGGALVVVLYVLLCLLYGFFVSDQWHQAFLPVGEALLGPLVPWLLGAWAAVAFTSTVLHYYYDGFIWKVRHKENRENLQLQDGAAKPASWWDAAHASSLGATIARQSVYFIPPMLFFTATYWMVSRAPATPPLRLATQAFVLQDRGLREEGRRAAQAAIASMDRQIEIERQMIEIQPSAEHYTYLAELTYVRSRTKTEIVDGLPRYPIAEEHRREVLKAAAALEEARKCPGALGHPERPDFTLAQLEQTLVRWRAEAAAPSSGELPRVAGES